jgi:hypothetical protein
MTSTELHRSFASAVTLLQQLRTEVQLVDRDLVDSLALRAEARRFAESLATITDPAGAKALLLADRAGADSFWFLLRSRWEAMETFLLPSAFELLPEPRPFAILCRCESWLEQMVPVETPEIVAPLADPDAPEVEWDHHLNTAEMPGIPRPVRIAFSSPALEPSEGLATVDIAEGVAAEDSGPALQG